MQAVARFASIELPRPFESVERVLGRKLRLSSPIDVHERIEEGFPRTLMIHLVDGLSILKPDESLHALNVSARTWHRIKADPGARLDKDQSSRVWNLAEVLAKAEEVLGSREDAEQWLASPAIGLNSHRPIDLMGTPQGAELVKTLLDQMAHGVYA
jgi:putative toxin-antitoxin system antitoxin component (TIGR02293 family)